MLYPRTGSPTLIRHLSRRGETRDRDDAVMTRLNVLATVLAACLLAPSLGLRGIWVPDETRYADVAQGMREDGGWITPTLAASTPIGHWKYQGSTSSFT